MRILQVRVPDFYLRGIDVLVKAGRYSSRSQAVRIAIRELLKRELTSIEHIRKELEAPFALPER